MGDDDGEHVAGAYERIDVPRVAAERDGGPSAPFGGRLLRRRPRRLPPGRLPALQVLRDAAQGETLL